MKGKQDMHFNSPSTSPTYPSPPTLTVNQIIVNIRAQGLTKDQWYAALDALEAAGTITHAKHLELENE